MYLNLIGLLLSFMTLLVVLAFGVRLMFYFLKKSSFPKKLFLTSLSGIVLVLALIGYTVFFFTFDSLDGEPYRTSVESPTGKYTANAYYKGYGGAAGGVNVWIDVTFHEEMDQVQTVYYSDAKSNFSMKWEDHDTLTVINDDPEYPDSNRSMTLEVGKDIYHESGLACSSLLLKDEYETCYKNE